MAPSLLNSLLPSAFKKKHRARKSVSKADAAASEDVNPDYMEETPAPTDPNIPEPVEEDRQPAASPEPAPTPVVQPTLPTFDATRGNPKSQSQSWAQPQSPPWAQVPVNRLLYGLRNVNLNGGNFHNASAVSNFHNGFNVNGAMPTNVEPAINDMLSNMSNSTINGGNFTNGGHVNNFSSSAGYAYYDQQYAR